MGSLRFSCRRLPLQAIQLLAERFMTNRDHKQSVMSLLPLLAVLFVATSVKLIAQSSPSSAANAPKPAYSHELPAMDGNHLRVFVSDIEVSPGESSPPHSHPCAVIGHVAAGAFRHQVKGEPEAVYKAGEDFYEPKWRARGIRQCERQRSSTADRDLRLRPRNQANGTACRNARNAE